MKLYVVEEAIDKIVEADEAENMYVVTGDKQEADCKVKVVPLKINEVNAGVTMDDRVTMNIVANGFTIELDVVDVMRVMQWMPVFERNMASGILAIAKAVASQMDGFAEVNEP